ncbi:hypothetical protein [Serratia sp. BIGb0163]
MRRMGQKRERARLFSAR